LRSDTAGYQEELLLYCGEGTDSRFGVIEFAVGADVTEAFRAEVRATAESEWKPLIRCVDGKPQQTDQEWAEVCAQLGRIQPQADCGTRVARPRGLGSLQTPLNRLSKLILDSYLSKGRESREF
jgi:hypothetical protein